MAFRIGTRKSPLALWQAYAVRDALKAHHGWGDEKIEIVELSTTGDRVQDRRLADFGGKGLFTRELDRALVDNEIDCAVHSLKDVPTFLPDEIMLAAHLPREDCRDAFICAQAKTLSDLPHGALVGTASLRREAQIKMLRPDLETTLLRGAVGTRLQAVKDGKIDATLLAFAGLKRLEMEHEIASVFSPDDVLPAVAQGIVGVAIRTGDADAVAAIAPLDDAESAIAATVERAFLAQLDGSCRSPIAGHAVISGDQIRFRGALMTMDGLHCAKAQGVAPIGEAQALGAAMGAEILAKAGPELLAVLEGD